MWKQPNLDVEGAPERSDCGCRVQFDDLYQEVKALGGRRASIFLAPARFLDDPELVEAVESRSGGAWRAWQQTSRNASD
jgi:hypothetical protein